MNDLFPDFVYIYFISRGYRERSYFLAYSCVLSRNGKAPYRELTLLAHRDNVKSVVETHRVYGSRQQSYFLIVFIYINQCL